MATEITVEIDDIHELMFKQLMDDVDDAPELEDWAEDTLEAVIYRSYQSQD